MTDTVLISRTTGGDTVNGKSVPDRGDGRVWIDEVWPAEPHRRIFSSTISKDKATRFDRDRAERLLRSGCWNDRDPQIENIG